LGFWEVEDLESGFKKINPIYHHLASKLAKDFEWEKLHIQMFLMSRILTAFERPASSSKRSSKHSFKTTNLKFRRYIAARYREAGSLFRPDTLPINWP